MSEAMAWSKHRVRDLIVHHASGPSPTCEERPVASPQEWGILKTTAVTWDGWDPSAHKVPPSEFWGKKSLEVRAGDVLVTKAGPRTRCGVAVYVPDTPPRIMVSGKMILLRPDTSKTNSVILASALATQLAQRTLDARTTGMADAQLNFTNSTLLELELAIPSIPEQVVITEMATAVDESIAQTSLLITKYQQIKAGLMHDLITRGVTSRATIRPSRAEAPHLYKDSPAGWIPKAWTYDHLENLTQKIVDGVHQTPNYVSDGIPFVTVKNLTASNDIDFSDLNYITAHDHRLFVARADPRPGDVLVTKDGTLGIARMVEERHPEFSIFVSVAQLRPLIARLRPYLLYLFFASGVFQRQMGRLSAGTGLKHIHLEHFRRFLIPLPPPGEQDAMKMYLHEVEGVIATEELYRTKLRREKSGLMHDLMTERIRIKLPRQTRNLPNV
jgi:type I restriction enzyme S subunit